MGNTFAKARAPLHASRARCGDLAPGAARDASHSERTTSATAAMPSKVQ